MLNIDKMEQIHQEHFIVFQNDPDLLHNMQSMHEKLLRAAVKHCECYATDILILIDVLPKRILREGITEIDICFRKMGVDWEYTNGESFLSPSEPYIYKMKLVYAKEGNTLTLYEESQEPQK